jgi:hypothetical protein
MSRNWFQLILKFLHFNSNEERNVDDRLYKVRPLLDHFCELFRTVYIPNQRLALDEGMLAWRGRLCFRVYNPGKLTKYGIIIRMVCDTATGYICNLEINCGQSGSLQNTVHGLLQPFAGVGHIVYMDNFYNSVKLTQILQIKNFGVVGTMRKNRGIPKRMTHVAEKLKRGEMTYKRRGDILVQAW